MTGLIERQVVSYQNMDLFGLAQISMIPGFIIFLKERDTLDGYLAILVWSLKANDLTY